MLPPVRWGRSPDAGRHWEESDKGPPPAGLVPGGRAAPREWELQLSPRGGRWLLSDVFLQLLVFWVLCQLELSAPIPLVRSSSAAGQARQGGAGAHRTLPGSCTRGPGNGSARGTGRRSGCGHSADCPRTCREKGWAQASLDSSPRADSSQALGRSSPEKSVPISQGSAAGVQGGSGPCGGGWGGSRGSL